MPILGPVIVWLLILALAIANGALREGVLLRILPRSLAIALSGVLLIGCTLLVTLLSIEWLGGHTALRFMLIGLLWLVLTLAFEFGLGLLIQGKSLASVLEAYRFKDGNLWPIILLAVAIAPLVAAHVRGMIPAQGGP